MTFAKVLPMAFVMIAGPQILSSVFLATSARWRQSSLAYIGGAAIAVTFFVTLAFLLSHGARSAGASDKAMYVVVLVLLIAAALHVYLKRAQSEPPTWMGKLQTATPGFAFKLGVLLLGVFPTDILTSFAVGTYVDSHHEAWWSCLPFIGLTLLFLATPLILVFALGARAQTVLPAVRDWMNNNSWVVNEIVIGFFVALTISDLV
jgi:hypothetical protein